jgi:outer membrane protein assembly factor BamB
MRRFIVRAYVAVAAGVVLGIAGVAGASASGAPAAAFRAVGAASAGASQAATGPGTQLWLKHYHQSADFGDTAYSVAVSPDGGTVFVTGKGQGIPFAGYATVAYNATTGAQLWAKVYNGGHGGAISVAVSPTGTTVFVTGSGPGAGGDYATIAYNAATGAQLWAKVYKSASAGAAQVAVSPTGTTVFVTGTSLDPTAGTDYATVAYNAATGAQLWAKVYRSPGRTNRACSVAVSPTGTTVFVTGTSGSLGAGTSEYATIAYNAATGAQQWLKLYKSSAGADASSVAVSPTGNTVFVTGNNGGRYGTVAYNAATGAQVWATLAKNSGARPYQLAVSPTGKTVFVTGFSENASLTDDYDTIAYNAATGAQVWAKLYKGKLGNVATSVAVSPTGAKVYVTGVSSGQAGGGGTYAYATVAYNAATGAQLWATQYTSGIAAVTGATSVAVSPANGTVFVTGQAQGNSLGLGDYVTIAYQG